MKLSEDDVAAILLAKYVIARNNAEIDRYNAEIDKTVFLLTVQLQAYLMNEDGSFATHQEVREFVERFDVTGD